MTYLKGGIDITSDNDSSLNICSGGKYLPIYGKFSLYDNIYRFFAGLDFGLNFSIYEEISYYNVYHADGESAGSEKKSKLKVAPYGGVYLLFPLNNKFSLNYYSHLIINSQKSWINTFGIGYRF